MKKLYFLNEEESIRILNLHKDATKRQYITENNKKLITEASGAYNSPLTDEDLESDVDSLVTELDGWVDDDNIENVYDIIKKYLTLFALNDDILDTPTIEPAIKRIVYLYNLEENGGNLVKEINNVGTTSLDNASIKKKGQIGQMITKGLALVKPVVPKTPAEIAKDNEKIAKDKAAAAVKTAADKTAAATTAVSKKTEDTSKLWKNFPCVLEHPNKTEEIYKSGEVSYVIGDINYESDGRKVTYVEDEDGVWQKEAIVRFTCNDREFKTGDASRVRELTQEQIEKWKNFPCVPKHPTAVEEEAGEEITYLINDTNYFSSGKKITYEKDANGEWKIKYKQKYTCNDPEFKTTRSGSTVKQLKTPSDVELDAVLGKL